MDRPGQAALPDDEPERLATLSSFELDRESERDLDDIVRLAADLCGTPIATVTFVDAERQWFKARVGLDIGETPRDVAFCAHTVLGDRPMVVPDALLDDRFRDNPLVTGDPKLRFYAGVPLTTSAGSAVGTLAVMDRVPRQLDALQRRALQVLARQIVKWLELRRAEAALRRRMHVTAEALDQATAERRRNERLYRTLWETTTDAVLIVDATSRIRFASPSCRELFGYTASELVGQPLAILQPARLRGVHEEGLARFLRTGERRVDWRATETVAVHRDGSEIDVEIAFSHMELDGQAHFVGFFRDIGDRKRSEREIHAEKERAQATLRAIGDAVVVLDELGRVAFMNPMAEKLTGWPAQAAVGHDHERVISFIAPDGAVLAQAGDSSEPVPLSGRALMLERRDGQSLSIEGHVAALRDREGRRSGSVVAFRDVSGWRQLTALLSHQATHDSLTGLVNRAELERRLQALTDAPANGQVHSLLYLDLDQFKVVNDTSGHVAGDQMLKHLADLLRAQLGPQDTIARLGGDEFGVLLEHCPTGPALRVAEKLRRTVQEFPFPWGTRSFSIGVSIGHICFRSGELSLAEVMGKADEACYLAKDLGRNRVHSYQAGDAELARRHGEMEWVLPLRAALKEDRFALHCQRIVSLQGHADPAHFEILLRMRDESGGLVPPMAFIPAAERYDLMPAIDRWVIASVSATLGARLARDPGARNCMYAVNLSGGSVTDAGLPRFIREQLARHGVPGQCLGFEITETAAIANLAQAADLMRDLKDLGCRFSLDDFGAGMSSFAYLKRLPVDFLKIDGSFVRGIASDPIDHAMVSSIHQIGKLMGLRTVAEFVESEAIIERLRAIGVDYGQGYGLERPIPFV